MVWVPCDRCLDDMELPISSSDKLMVKFGHEYAEEGDNPVSYTHLLLLLLSFSTSKDQTPD